MTISLPAGEKVCLFAIYKIRTHVHNVAALDLFQPELKIYFPRIYLDLTGFDIVNCIAKNRS